MNDSDALSDLEREVARGPRDGCARGRLARACGDAEHHELAFEAFRLATRFAPESAGHWSGLAIACLKRDDEIGALEAARKAAELALHVGAGARPRPVAFEVVVR